jgi:3-hydroxymyristoyl/3-hydroxydecanoyl-(acyl carrier protein) dehydratase
MDTLDFPRVIRAAYGDGVRIFVEIGPGTSCTRMIGRILEGMPYSARSACAPGQGEVSSILRLLAHLIAEGVPISLHSLYGREDAAIPPPSRQKAAPRPITVETGGKPFVINPPAGAKAPAPPPVPAVLRVEPAPAKAAAIPRVQGEDRSPSRFLGFISKGFESAQLARAEAHEAYLSLSRSITGSISQNLAFQMSLVEKGGSGLQAIPAYSPPRLLEPVKADPPGPASSPPPSPAARPFMDRAKCMEFAIGAIGAVLGGRYSAIDGHPTRVRLPDEPLMLVDRIMAVEGEPLSLTTGRVITQHDVSPGAWYLDGGRIPTCIAVEAGQADLFLSGYLGIDLRTKGLAVYRLLDAEVTFHRPLPGPGSVIQYDIRIDNFFLQGDTYLFKFRFDSTVGGEPLLTMRNGCAGFFTAKDLAGGKGIVHTKLDTMPVPGKKPPRWEPPVPMQVESYSDEQVDALRKGDLPGCFGPAFSGLPVTNPLTIPGGRMKLVNRVLHLDPRGGRFGLGLVHAEADIQPEDWFLTCHFCDDNVMPGTLMYECCMHTLRIMLLRMGWVAGSEGAAWEPVPGVSSQLKCRGQVIDTTRRASYEVSIKEIGFAPEPYAIADALMYADGKPIVEIINMSIRLSGTTGEQIETMWRNKSAEELPAPDEPVPPPFDRDSILAFAVGRPSEAFGEPYRVFDRERVIARLPGPPYQFLDRITRIQAEPWKMTPGGKIEARYDVPPGEWYFASNGLDTMPFAVLLEVALQPCGWLAAYAGSALTSETDLSFRNLGGSAVQYREIGTGGGTLITRVGLTGVSSSGGMIIQHYDFDVFMGEERVYRGNTYFGFFSKEALANQVGIRDARLYVPSEEEAAMSGSFDFPAGAPCPGPMLRMIDRVEMFVPGGGPHGLGYVKGTLTVNPDAWYFKAHFYQDPVIPGSLGLESFFQLMRLFAVKKFGWEEGRPITGPVLGMKHQWLYRGQVIPGDKKVTVDMWINSVDERNRVIFAEGYLSVDGRIIYQMKDFSLRV